MFFCVRAVVILCAEPDTVRNLMLQAQRSNFLKDNEYVFINIDLFGRCASAASTRTSIALFPPSVTVPYLLLTAPQLRIRYSELFSSSSVA